eukprot:70990-Chlamydomonas_euryale.AAC.4
MAAAHRRITGSFLLLCLLAASLAAGRATVAAATAERECDGNGAAAAPGQIRAEGAAAAAMPARGASHGRKGGREVARTRQARRSAASGVEGGARGQRSSLCARGLPTAALEGEHGGPGDGRKGWGRAACTLRHCSLARRASREARARQYDRSAFSSNRFAQAWSTAGRSCVRVRLRDRSHTPSCAYCTGWWAERVKTKPTPLPCSKNKPGPRCGSTDQDEHTKLSKDLAEVVAALLATHGCGGGCLSLGMAADASGCHHCLASRTLGKMLNPRNPDRESLDP